MKKIIKTILKIFFSLALISYSLYKAGVLDAQGREKFILLIQNADIFLLIVSFAVTIILNLSSSLKWKMLLASRGIDVSLIRLYVYYNIGKFFNLILPTSMGGDIVRIFKLGAYIGEKNTAAASVIVERFTGMITLMIFAAIAVVINIKRFNQEWLTLSLAAGILILLVITGMVLSSRIFHYFERIFKKTKISFLSKIFYKIDKIRRPVLEYKSDKKAIVWAVANSIIFQMLAVVNVWISSMVFSSKIDFITCLVAVPVVLFIMNIPFSIGGVGLMEFGYVFTFSLFGIAPSVSLSTALLVRVKGMVDSAVGGIFYLTKVY